LRRSERLIRTTKWLIDRPNEAVSLSVLAAQFAAAKSSMSEDVGIIRDVVRADGSGIIESLVGAGGGIRFRAAFPPKRANDFLDEMAVKLSTRDRVLPGGFLYMSDVLGNPDVLDAAGKMFAERFANLNPNVVVTVETKGIPLAVATARYLHVPLVVVRREHKVTDGSVVSVHYISGSERRIQTMSISKRAMPVEARALVVDDFLKAGATVKALSGLLGEFDAEVVGIAIFMSAASPSAKLVAEHSTLFWMDGIEENREVTVRVADGWIKHDDGEVDIP